MAGAGNRESWDAGGGLTFSQPTVGNGGVEADDVWDDGAILKAFDDALTTHTRKPVNLVEARKWNKHAAQEIATQSGGTVGRGSSSRGVTGYGPHGPMGNGEHSAYQDAGAHGLQQGDGRFAALLGKGGAEQAARARAEGIPGPWEPVTGAREGDAHQHRGIPPHEAARRFDYGRGLPYDDPRAEESGASYYPYGAHPPPHPHAGGAARLEERWERHGIPPPPVPPAPHGGVGPHAAAFQSLDGVYDDDLADLLLAWYYSGYYTGRYRAMQEARKARYRRQYPPVPGHGSMQGHGPMAGHGPPTPSAAPYGGESEGWDRQSWQGHPSGPPAPGQSPAARAGQTDFRGTVGKRPPGS